MTSADARVRLPVELVGALFVTMAPVGPDFGMDQG